MSIWLRAVFLLREGGNGLVQVSLDGSADSNGVLHQMRDLPNVQWVSANYDTFVANDILSPTAANTLNGARAQSSDSIGMAASPQQTEFELRGAIIGSPGPMNLVFDNDLTTSWVTPSAAEGSWAGMDFGAGNAYVLTRWRFAPRSQMYSETERWIFGTVLQASNDPTFGTGVVTLDTIPAFPYNPRWQLSERALSVSAPYRCFRVVSAIGSYGSIAEVKFIGFALEGIPLPPTMSPWGGRYLNGFAEVTLDTDTTTAQIHYTTDGSTPTLNSALYTGPFSLDCTGIPNGVTVRARAYDPGQYLLTSADLGFIAAFDYNGDGRIDIADFGQFSVRYFTTLP